MTRFGVGSAVYVAFWLAGTFADYVRVPTLRVAVAQQPTTLDFAPVAALPTPALAALTALRAVTITTGDTLLVVGATGGWTAHAYGRLRHILRDAGRHHHHSLTARGEEGDTARGQIHDLVPVHVTAETSGMSVLGKAYDLHHGSSEGQTPGSSASCA